MSKFIIRSAEEKDVLQIAKMIYQWSHWGRERDDVIRKAIQDKDSEVLVAELDGKIVGVLQLRFFLDILLGGYNCHVAFLLVNEKYRGRKIGSKLLDRAIDNAKKRGVLEMHVDTIFNEAVKFYKRRGFKDDGVMLELSLQS